MLVLSILLEPTALYLGSRGNNVNFILADMAEGTEVILGHPFLPQSCACLDYGQVITLFDEKIPCFGLCPQPEVLVAMWSLGFSSFH